MGDRPDPPKPRRRADSGRCRGICTVCPESSDSRAPHASKPTDTSRQHACRWSTDILRGTAGAVQPTNWIGASAARPGGRIWCTGNDSLPGAERSNSSRTSCGSTLSPVSYRATPNGRRKLLARPSSALRSTASQFPRLLKFRSSTPFSTTPELPSFWRGCKTQENATTRIPPTFPRLGWHLILSLALPLGLFSPPT